MQTDPTLLRYASAITDQKKCWEFLAQNFDRFQTKRTTPNNTQQHATTCNRVCKRPNMYHPTMLRPLHKALLPKGYSHIWAIRYVSLNRVFFDFPDFVTGYKNYPLSLEEGIGYILVHRGRFFPHSPWFSIKLKCETINASLVIGHQQPQEQDSYIFW